MNMTGGTGTHMCTDVGPHVSSHCMNLEWFSSSDELQDRMRSAGFAELQCFHNNRLVEGLLKGWQPGKIFKRRAFLVPHMCDHLDEVGQAEWFRWSKNLSLPALSESIQILSLIAILWVAKPLKYVNFHHDWILCKVWWLVEYVKVIKKAVEYARKKRKRKRKIIPWITIGPRTFGARALIKAASGVERALAPPRPSGSPAVKERARRRSKYRVQLNKFVKRTVQLHWKAYFLVPLGGAMSVIENRHTDAFRLAPVWNA